MMNRHRYQKLGLVLSAMFVFVDCGDDLVEYTGLDRIKIYAQDGGIAPTLQDYKGAGVIGIDSKEELLAINEVVRGLEAKDVDTAKEIQALVDVLSIEVERVHGEINHHGIKYGRIKSPYTNKVWLDRNLGASRVCTDIRDKDCYGDYYQWGRDADGHEKSDSKNINIENVDEHNTNFFITSNLDPYDWISRDNDGSSRSDSWSNTDGSSVCPEGFRVPTFEELKNETLDRNVTNYATAFASFLRLSASGGREHNSSKIRGQGVWGGVWTSTPTGRKTLSIEFNSTDGNEIRVYRAFGMPVRCIKDE